MSDMPERVRRCTTHHHACDCREYEFEQAKVRIEALEKAARGVVEARGIGFMQVHKEDVPEFMHLMNRIDKLAALLEEGE